MTTISGDTVTITCAECKHPTPADAMFGRTE